MSFRIDNFVPVSKFHCNKTRCKKFLNLSVRKFSQIAKADKDELGNISQGLQENNPKQGDMKKQISRDSISQKSEEQSKSSEGSVQVQPRKISINDIPQEYQRLAKKSAKRAQNSAAKTSKLTSQTQSSDSEQSTTTNQKYSPKMCSEAISLGLQQFEKQNYYEAIELFTVSLELPGNGAYRFADSVREYSCPSDGEEQAALYNLTCCYAKLQQSEAALICLEGLLESGFEDFQQLRNDPDLKSIQGKQFNEIVSKFDTPQNFVGKLFGGKKDKEDKQPGLLW
eukprot:TRINITY_DN6606_c0_g2_i3.p1 TRINITY_DN6606_c0_g2~~TRINITY_DN6606_c0_g2_i3.p1  ORF type:complete len:283 (+),score=43.13 TRINITY_DN6606_c0_g2_i3:321-1169(+)